MKFETKTIHEGQPNDPLTGAVSFPIYQTSTYEQIEPGVTKGFSYGRTDNPTRLALEKALASIEEGNFGLCFSSGLSAANTIMNLLSKDSHIIAVDDLYGGTWRLFTKLYRKFGVEFTFLDLREPEKIREGVRKNTRILWLESPTNPLLKIIDIEKCVKIAKEYDLLVVVDNTFATPYLQKPLKLGADIVLHSTTKYLNGHADVIGGALIVNSESIYQELKFYQNAVGGVPSPFDCFLVLRGLKTLPLRMERHCKNAKKIAEFLRSNPKVKKVYFPGLEEHEGHETAKKQMKDYGGMLSFELDTDFNGLKRFFSSLKIITLAESLGSVKSLICHPATMTHASVEPEVRKKRGITDSLVRLSVGIEDVEDLIEDLSNGIKAI
jgi:cystathionine beta-lyase/cystathionine gamma-synthase